MLTREGKIAIITIIVLPLVGFAFGRWAAPEKIKVETKIIEVEKKIETKDKEIERNRHKETTVVVVTRPDGSKEEHTHTVEDNSASGKSSSASTSEKDKNTEESREETRGTARVTVLALAAVTATDLGKPPVFGLSISKPILGPITVGLFGFTDARVGVSLGLTF